MSSLESKDANLKKHSGVEERAPFLFRRKAGVIATSTPCFTMWQI
jgi:hypothetical protein